MHEIVELPTYLTRAITVTAELPRCIPSTTQVRTLEDNSSERDIISQDAQRVVERRSLSSNCAMRGVRKKSTQQTLVIEQRSAGAGTLLQLYSARACGEMLGNHRRHYHNPRQRYKPACVRPIYPPQNPSGT